MSSSTLAAGLRHLCRKLAAQERNEESDEQLLHAFTSRRDDSAFAVILHRHGPMVLHVCRRVLDHEQDAEDAFQATFLVLAQSAARLRNKTALASFLHGIAYRIARKARLTAVRRRKHEGALGALTQPRSPVDAADELSWREVRILLDEEIARLPEIYRSVFILCCLEELSRAEAARRLGLKECTVYSRLAEARKRLAQRLARRGVELTAVLAATTLATLSAELMASTIKAPWEAAAGEGLTGIVSASVAELVKNMAQVMMRSKMKTAALILLTATVLGGGGVWFAESTIDKQTGERGRVSAPSEFLPSESLGALTQPRSPETAKSNVIQGRVLNPDGKPVQGAKLLFLWWIEELPIKIWATSGADGRFAFAVARSPAANSGWQMPGRERPYVLAAAEGYGFAVVRLDNLDAAANLTLRLVKDDLPIRGRVIDLQGKPIAGVRVRINDLEPHQPQVYVPKSGNLADFLAALKANKKDPWRVEEDCFMMLFSPAFHLLFPPVTTGADGRFELRGIGRERLVHLRLEGPTIATEVVNAMTRISDQIKLPLSRNAPKGWGIIYYGATLEVLAAPTKPVVGVVRDRVTGKPLAGVTIKPSKIANRNIGAFNAARMQTVTDKDGRYRLIGLPKGEDNQLMATTDELPYLSLSKKVENTPGLEAVAVDFDLKRGIWVKGRVTEKTTGKPLKGGVGYYCFDDNPHYKDIPGKVIIPGGRTRADGSYRFVVVPGRGLIAVQVSYNDRYLCGVGAEKIKGPTRKMGEYEGFDTYPSMCQTWNQNTIVEINPKPTDESITCDLIVDPGRTLKGKVLDPDGKPLAGARKYRWDTLPGSEFTVWGLPAGKLAEPQEIEFVHEGKKLAGFVTVHGDEKGPLQVRLQPWGAITGRLVTPEGEPLTGVKVYCRGAGEDRSDKQGRFRIEGLTPGITYKWLSVSKEGFVLSIIGGEPKNMTVQPGETKELRVLKVKRKE